MNYASTNSDFPLQGINMSFVENQNSELVHTASMIIKVDEEPRTAVFAS
jgi:hypothetical protein